MRAAARSQPQAARSKSHAKSPPTKRANPLNKPAASERLAANWPPPRRQLAHGGQLFVASCLLYVAAFILPAPSPVLALKTSPAEGLAARSLGPHSLVGWAPREPEVPTQTNRTQSDAASRDERQLCALDEPVPAGAELEASEVRQLDGLLAAHYKLPRARRPLAEEPNAAGQTTNPAERAKPADQPEDGRPELPRPHNLTVLIISWYPPILKLNWQLNEQLTADEASSFNFYAKHTNGSLAGHPQEPQPTDQKLGMQSSSMANEPFDLELAVDQGQTEDATLETRLAFRRLLVKRSLSCFQVTYNIINSRYKVSEEYPPYLRSVNLERLLPATEYSLRVVAIYLQGRYLAASQRVSFVSPTDNESRRFKENSYRPIHRYPDEEPRRLRTGLAQVRSEELTIVAIAIIFWLATIYLFINKWGKIRMLEPYQPAYRDQSGSSASFAAAQAAAAAAAAHHHSSLQHLCSPGVPLVAAAATQAAGVSAPGEQSLPAKQQAPTGVGSSSDWEAHQQGARLSEGGLTAGPGACRKASRSLLLMSNKRFETVANDSSPIGVRRTDAELNFLFQSKAMALAKATSLWSRQQQANLKQLQYCRPEQQLERLRRTSQALLKQRGLSTAGHRTASERNTSASESDRIHAGSLAAGHALTSSLGGRTFNRELLSRVQANQLQKTPTDRSTEGPSDLETRDLAMMANHANSSRDTNDSAFTPAQSMDQSPRREAHQKDSLNSNRMRRLLFITKSHQHHHIATSTSSSTLLKLHSSSLNSSNRATAPTRRASPASGPGGTGSIRNSSLLLNSISLDAAESTNNSPRRQVAADTTSSSSLPSDGILESQLQQHPFKPPSSKPQQQPTGRHQPPIRVKTTPAEAPRSLATSGRASLVEHHILIEPPSPPTQRDSFAAIGELTTAQPARDIDREVEAAIWPNAPLDDQQAAEQMDGVNFRVGETQDQELCSSSSTTGGGCGAELELECDETDDYNEPFAKLAKYQADKRRQTSIFLAGSELQSCGTPESFAQSALQLAQSPTFEYLTQRHHSSQQLYYGDCQGGGTSHRGRRRCSHRLPSDCLDERYLSLIESQGSGGLVSSLGQASLGQASGGSQLVCPERRPRLGSVFVGSPYKRSHRDSFALLRALSQKKSKSAEDVACLSSLVLQIWTRERNPLLQSASQQHLSGRRARDRRSTDEHQSVTRRPRHRSSLNVSQL